MVTTVAGTGTQGHDYTGGEMGKKQGLSSPWDVAIYHHKQDGREVPVLLIAIAGIHQIWALFLEDTTWWKNKYLIFQSCCLFHEIIDELIRNTIFLENAKLALA